MGAAKRWKGCGRGDGVAGEAEESGLRRGLGFRWLDLGLCRASNRSRDFAEDEGFARLDADAGEVKMCAEAGKRGFDEVEFAGRDAAGDEEHVGFASLCRGGVEGFGSVGGGGQDDGLGAGSLDTGRRAWARWSCGFCPGPGVASTGTSSSPVVRIATRGRT